MSEHPYKSEKAKEAALAKWKADAIPYAFFGARLTWQEDGKRDHITTRLLKSGALILVTVWFEGTRTTYTVEA